MAVEINQLKIDHLFATGTNETTKVDIMEWSIPAPWRAKFDLDN
jgi:hypothetical protein